MRAAIREEGGAQYTSKVTAIVPTADDRAVRGVTHTRNSLTRDRVIPLDGAGAEGSWFMVMRIPMSADRGPRLVPSPPTARPASTSIHSLHLRPPRGALSSGVSRTWECWNAGGTLCRAPAENPSALKHRLDSCGYFGGHGSGEARAGHGATETLSLPGSALASSRDTLYDIRIQM